MQGVGSAGIWQAQQQQLLGNQMTLQDHENQLQMQRDQQAALLGQQTYQANKAFDVSPGYVDQANAARASQIKSDAQASADPTVLAANATVAKNSVIKTNPGEQVSIGGQIIAENTRPTPGDAWMAGAHNQAALLRDQHYSDQQVDQVQSGLLNNLGRVYTYKDPTDPMSKPTASPTMQAIGMQTFNDGLLRYGQTPAGARQATADALAVTHFVDVVARTWVAKNPDVAKKMSTEDIRNNAFTQLLTLQQQAKGAAPAVAGPAASPTSAAGASAAAAPQTTAPAQPGVVGRALDYLSESGRDYTSAAGRQLLQSRVREAASGGAPLTDIERLRAQQAGLIK